MAAKRRWSERMLLVSNLIVANAIAALWIATFLQPSVLGTDLGKDATAMSGTNRAMVMSLQTPAAWLAFFGSVGLLLWNFSWLVRRRAGEVPSNWVVSETVAGTVRVAREAIETGLRVAGEVLPEITRLRVQVKLPSSKRIQITGQFYCADGQNHLAGSQRLRQALLHRFGELVQLSDGTRAELELEFQGFFGKLDKNAPEPPEPTLAPAPDEEVEPFRGPQYPIDDEPIGGNQ
ncbi:MAG: hypothetical protein ACI89X_002419 [Planctomycetota bacterium]|jgi:hypothetical protein